MSMRLRRPALLASALLLAAAGVHAQAPAQPAARGQELRELCATISMTPADGREMARRAECVLAGVLPSPNRIAEARSLARAALAADEPSGGLMLYLTYQADPANQFVRDGKRDPQAYRRLAARSLKERQEQIEAIEGLGHAAGRNNTKAAMLLAHYFHETAAPRNVARVGAMSALLMRLGERSPLVDRYAREADAVAMSAGATKTSVRSFLETYQQAAGVARSTYQAQNAGKICEKPELGSVSSGDIQGEEYLPLRGNLVRDSYLVKGQWSEFWNFHACGQDVPLKVNFAADGWGGTTAEVRYNKGD
jgi:hypothetical protein